MWFRYELKSRAKDMLRKCFWPAVVVCLISGIFTGEFAKGTNSGHHTAVKQQYVQSIDTAKEVIRGEANAKDVAEQVKNSLLMGFLPLMIGVSLVIVILGLLISLVIGGPILVGSKRFFMCNRTGEANIGMIFYGFRSGHVGNIIFSIFVKNLKIFLWGLLLVVPGIIKSYEYRMMPYILSENPGIEMRKAFQLSADMMYGQKWEVFVLDLSFLLWNLLGAVTWGLANIFYVHPYAAATNAELYAVLREDALRRGAANAYELPGYAE